MALERTVKKEFNKGYVRTEDFGPIEQLYGPHSNKSSALTYTAGYRYLGLTVGVIENGKVEDYQFKKGIADIDLVKKLDTILSDSSEFTI